MTPNDFCVECRKSTAPGSNRWVGRLDTGNGWICVSCFYPQLCDMCEAVPPMDDDLFCKECYDEHK